jgi:hypothetical protein
MPETIQKLLKEGWYVLLNQEDILVIGKGNKRMVCVHTPHKDFLIHYEMEGKK